jgi:hypothetical protein
MTTNTCPCGRALNAGRSASSSNAARCLICQVAAVMRTFRDPITARSQERTKREKERRDG